MRYFQRLSHFLATFHELRLNIRKITIYFVHIEGESAVTFLLGFIAVLGLIFVCANSSVLLIKWS